MDVGFIDRWNATAYSDKPNSGTALKNLHTGIIGTIKDAFMNRLPIQENGPYPRELRPLEDFFERDDDGMDDCIRWRLLYESVTNTDDATLLIGMIMRKNPYLAFNVTTKKSLEGKCRLSHISEGKNVQKGGKSKDAISQKSKEKKSHFDSCTNTPSSESIFSVAVRLARDNTVKTILESAKIYLESEKESAHEKLLSLARGGKTTAIEAAIEGGEISAVGVVLKILPDIITSDDTALYNALSSAMKEGSTEAIDMFIGHEQTRHLLTSRNNIIKALKIMEDVDENQEAFAKEQLQKIIKVAPSEECYSLEVIGPALQHGLIDLWSNMSNSEQLESIPGLLHMAVVHHQHNFVRKLLKSNPGLVLEREEIPDMGNANKNGIFPNTNGVSNGVGKNISSSSDAKKEKENPNSKYPLWYNSHYLNGNEPTRLEDIRKIRSVLIYYTVKHAPGMQELSEILQNSEEPERELSFDMSRLNFEQGRVAEFFQSFSLHDPSCRLLNYEETIRYAEFPVLDLREDEYEWPQSRAFVSTAHTEVFDTLDWLASHGVRRIISLKVPDRMMNPHDEGRIAEIVRRFRVEELDWRFLDLSVAIFQPHGRRKDRKIDLPLPTDTIKKSDPTFLTRLHLYSSGKRSAMDHWFGSEGIRAMNLKRLDIHIVNELQTQPAAKATAAYMRTQLDKIKKEQLELETQIDSEFWNPKHQLIFLNEIAQKLSPRLAQFTEFYRNYALKKYQRSTGHNDKYPATKVAIIDNGILTVLPHEVDKSGKNSSGNTYTDNNNANMTNGSGNGTLTPKEEESAGKSKRSKKFFEKGNLWSRICEGKSFIGNKERASPWFLASNPHGTQMANLLCAIDPLCELYVAKIADGKYGYSGERAAAAVRWAMKKNVDIISMSFTTDTTCEDFKTALSDAANAGIILVCSLHDEGGRADIVYPADVDLTYPRKLRITSCDEFGKLKPDVDNSKYDYCIGSQNIAAGVIPFLTRDELISGSSAATALVAGLCSLILSCTWVTKEYPCKDEKIRAATATDRKQDKLKDTASAFNKVKSCLDDMFLNADTRFLILERFANLHTIKEINNDILHETLWSVGAEKEDRRKTIPS